MAAHSIFVLILVSLTLFSTICEVRTDRDIWSKELEASYKVCRGRLPDPVEGADLGWIRNKTRFYVKYSDQVSFLRLMHILVGGPKSEEPVSKIRCLFESPCITMELNGLNRTATGCTGTQAHFDYLPKASGVADVTVSYPDGTVGYTVIAVPALTDRKSYVVYMLCFDDGLLGFSVMTTRAGLSAYTRHVIKEFLDNSGFNDNFRIVTNFMSSSCKVRL